jgi:hypothetical protein
MHQSLAVVVVEREHEAAVYSLPYHLGAQMSLRSMAALLWVLFALGCGDDRSRGGPMPLADASVDGGRAEENPDAAWPASSTITALTCEESAGCTSSYCKRGCESLKCALDLDCNAGSYCSLGVCTQDCDEGRPCVGGASCGERGRCLPLAAKQDVMPPPPVIRQGQLALSPATLEFAPGESSKKLSLKVSGLTPMAPFKYRVETRSRRLDTGSLAPLTVKADTAGSVSVELEAKLTSQSPDAPLEASAIEVVSEAGSLSIPVTIRPNPFGTFAGSISIASPQPLGLVPLSFRLWPASDAGTSGAIVELIADGSVLFPSGRVLPATFDAASGRITFALNTIVDAETWGDADLSNYSPAAASPNGSLPKGLTPSGTWNWARMSGPLPNPFHRVVGRQIQVSMTLDASGNLTGTYGERIHGLLPASTVDVVANLTARRIGGLEAMTQTSGMQVAPPLSSNLMPELPSGQASTTAGMGLAVACEDVAACGGVSEASATTLILACAKQAAASALGLQQAFAIAGGAGKGYRSGYATCTDGDMDGPPAAVAPQITRPGCVDEKALSCALEGYRKAVQNILAPGADVPPVDQLDAYAGLLAAQRIPSVAYVFMGNDYRAQAVRAAVLSGTDLTQPMNTIRAQASALGFASSSYYAASYFALNPVLLQDLRVTPLSIATPDGVERNVRGEVRNALEGAMLALGQFGSTLSDELSVRWRQSDIAASELALMRQAMLAIYTGAAVISAEAARRGVANLLGIDDVRTALSRLSRQHAARAQGANPLGYDPNFVPISGSLDSMEDTNFKALDAEYASSIKRATASWSEFRSASDQWSRTQQELEGELRAAIDGYDPQLTQLCGVAPPPHPGWMGGSNGGVRKSVEPMEITAYKQSLDAYLASCFSMGRGRFGEQLKALDQARLEVSIADAQLSALFAQVDIERGRIERKVGKRKEYLSYRLADGSQLHALDMEEYDIRAREIKRTKPNLGFSLFKQAFVGTVGLVAAAALPASAALFAASAVESAKSTASTFLDQAEKEGDYEAAKRANEQRKEIAEQKHVIEQRMAGRVVMEANDLEVIDSQAQVLTMLTRQAEQVLRIQQAQLNAEGAALALQNLITQVRDLLARRDSAIESRLSSSFAFTAELTARTTSNAEAVRYAAAFAQAQSETFELLRALEYEINADTQLAAKVFAANTPSELSDLRDQLQDTYECFQRRFGSRTDYESVINVRRDILGISEPWRDPVTDLVYTSKEQFQRALRSQDTLDADGKLTLTFETNLTANDLTGYAVSSTTRCNDLIRSIDVQLVGDGLGGTSAALLLSQSGTGLVRACDMTVSGGLAAYDLSLSGNNQRAALQAGVNAFRDNPNYQLASRPLASTRWEITLDPKDPANRGLDLSAVENMLIRIRSSARPSGAASAIGECL